VTSGRPFVPQHDQSKRLIQAPWVKYLQLVDRTDPALIQILAIFRDYELTGIEVTDESASIAIKLGRQQYERGMEERVLQQRRLGQAKKETETFRKLLDDNPDGIVYYIRRGEFVKIGTTTRYRNRMKALLPDEVLAVEPGSYSIEDQRHRQFASCRLYPGSEYFRITDDLISHVVALRAEHGVPDNTMVSVSDRKTIIPSGIEEVLAVLKSAGFSDAVHVGGGVIGWVNQIEPSKPVY
jgi:hypothetical protein